VLRGTERCDLCERFLLCPSWDSGELIDYAKQHPGKFRCANPGAISASTFAFELVQSAAGVKVISIPTKGGGQQVPLSVLGGHAELAVGSISVLTNYVQNGDLRIFVSHRS
jgi:tripartite-type tricarboxylate transporter receptor subunit TctC